MDLNLGDNTIPVNIEFRVDQAKSLNNMKAALSSFEKNVKGSIDISISKSTTERIGALETTLRSVNSFKFGELKREIDSVGGHFGAVYNKMGEMGTNVDKFNKSVTKMGDHAVATIDKQIGALDKLMAKLAQVRELKSRMHQTNGAEGSYATQTNPFVAPTVKATGSAQSIGNFNKAMEALSRNANADLLSAAKSIEGVGKGLNNALGVFDRQLKAIRVKTSGRSAADIEKTIVHELTHAAVDMLPQLNKDKLMQQIKADLANKNNGQLRQLKAEIEKRYVGKVKNENEILEEVFVHAVERAYSGLGTGSNAKLASTVQRFMDRYFSSQAKALQDATSRYAFSLDPNQQPKMTAGQARARLQGQGATGAGGGGTGPNGPEGPNKSPRLPNPERIKAVTEAYRGLCEVLHNCDVDGFVGKLDNMVKHLTAQKTPIREYINEIQALNKAMNSLSKDAPTVRFHVTGNLGATINNAAGAAVGAATAPAGVRNTGGVHGVLEPGNELLNQARAASIAKFAASNPDAVLTKIQRELDGNGDIIRRYVVKMGGFFYKMKENAMTGQREIESLNKKISESASGLVLNDAGAKATSKYLQNLANDATATIVKTVHGVNGMTQIIERSIHDAQGQLQKVYDVHNINNGKVTVKTFDNLSGTRRDRLGEALSAIDPSARDANLARAISGEEYRRLQVAVEQSEKALKRVNDEVGKGNITFTEAQGKIDAEIKKLRELGDASGMAQAKIRDLTQAQKDLSQSQRLNDRSTRANLFLNDLEAHGQQVGIKRINRQDITGVARDRESNRLVQTSTDVLKVGNSYIQLTRVYDQAGRVIDVTTKALKNHAEALRAVGSLTGKTQRSMADMVETAGRVILSYGLITQSISLTKKAIESSILGANKLEQAQFDIKKILNIEVGKDDKGNAIYQDEIAQRGTLNRLQEKAIEISRLFGTSREEVLGVTRDFIALYQDEASAINATVSASKLAIATNIKLGDSTKYLVSVATQFKLTAKGVDEFVDKINQVTNLDPTVKADLLIQNIQRVGPAAFAAGVSIDKIIALTTVGMKTFGSATAEIGNALKTFLQFVSSSDKQGVIAKFLGVDKKSLDGVAKDDLIEKIQNRVVELQKKSLELSKTGRKEDLKQAERIKGEIDQFFSKYGGATQGSRLTGIFGDKSEFDKLLGKDGKIKDAADSARKEAAIQLQSLTNTYNSALASLQILGERVGLAVIPTIKSILREAKDLFISIDKNREQLQDGFQRLGIIISPIGSLFKGAFEDVRDTIGALIKGVELLGSLFKFDKKPIDEMRKSFEGVNEIARQLGKTLAAIGLVALGAKAGAGLKDRILGTSTKFGGDAAAGAAFTGQVAVAGSTFTSEVIAAGAAFAAEVQAGGAVAAGAKAGEAGLAAAAGARATTAAAAGEGAAAASKVGFFGQITAMFAGATNKIVTGTSNGLFKVAQLFENTGVRAIQFASRLEQIGAAGARVGSFMVKFASIFEWVGGLSIRAAGLFSSLGTKLLPVMASLTTLASRLLPGVATGLLGLVAAAAKFMAHPAVQVALAVGHVGVRLFQTNQAAAGVSASYDAKTEAVGFAETQLGNYEKNLENAKKRQSQIDSDASLSPAQKAAKKAEIGSHIQVFQKEISDLKGLIDNAKSEAKNLATFQRERGPIGTKEDVYGFTHESRLVERKKALDDAVQAVNDRLGEARSIEDAKRSIAALQTEYTNTNPTTKEGADNTSLIVDQEKRNASELARIDKLISLSKRRMDIVKDARQANEISTAQEVQGLQVVLGLNQKTLMTAKQLLDAKIAASKDDVEKESLMAKQLQISEMLRDNARAILESQKKLYMEVVQTEEARLSLFSSYNELQGDSTAKALGSFSIKKQELNIEMAKYNAFKYTYEKSLELAKTNTGNVETAAKAINLEAQGVEIQQQKAAIAQKIVALGMEYKNVLEQQFRTIGEISGAFGKIIGTGAGQAASALVTSTNEALKAQVDSQMKFLEGQDASIAKLKSQLEYYKNIAAYQTAIEDQEIQKNTFGLDSTQQNFAKSLVERDRLLQSSKFTGRALDQVTSQLASNGYKPSNESEGITIVDVQAQANKIKYAIDGALESGALVDQGQLRDLVTAVDKSKGGDVSDFDKFTEALKGLTPQIQEEIKLFNLLNEAFALNSEKRAQAIALIQKEYEIKQNQRALDSEILKSRMDELEVLNNYLDMQDKVDESLGRSNLIAQAGRDQLRRTATLTAKYAELRDIESELALEDKNPTGFKNLAKIRELNTKKFKVQVEIEGVRNTIDPLRKALIDISSDFSNAFREGFSSAFAKTLAGPDVQKLEDLTIKVRELKEKGLDYDKQIADLDADAAASAFGESESVKKAREFADRAQQRSKLVRERYENAQAVKTAEAEKEREENPLSRFAYNYRESMKKAEQESNQKLFEFIGKVGADFLRDPDALKNFGKTPDQLLKEAGVDIHAKVSDAGEIFRKKILELVEELDQKRKNLLNPAEDDVLKTQGELTEANKGVLAEMQSREDRLTDAFKDGVSKFGVHVDNFGKSIGSMGDNLKSLIDSFKKEESQAAGAGASADYPTNTPSQPAEPSGAPSGAGSRLPLVVPGAADPVRAPVYQRPAPSMDKRSQGIYDRYAQGKVSPGAFGTMAKYGLVQDDSGFGSRPPSLSDPDPAKRKVAEDLQRTGYTWNPNLSYVENLQNHGQLRGKMQNIGWYSTMTPAEMDIMARSGIQPNFGMSKEDNIRMFRYEAMTRDPNSLKEHDRIFKNSTGTMSHPNMEEGLKPELTPIVDEFNPEDGDATVDDGDGSFHQASAAREGAARAELRTIGGGGGPGAKRNAPAPKPPVRAYTPKNYKVPARPTMLLPSPQWNQRQPKPAPKPPALNTFNWRYAEGVTHKAVRINGYPVRAEMAPGVLRMMSDARKAGFNVSVGSGLRDYDKQNFLYRNRHNPTIVPSGRAAYPGYSNHEIGHGQTGAVDFHGLEDPRAKRWFDRNAHKYNLAPLSGDYHHYNYVPPRKGASNTASLPADAGKFLASAPGNARAARHAQAPARAYAPSRGRGAPRMAPSQPVGGMGNNATYRQQEFDEIPNFSAPRGMMNMPPSEYVLSRGMQPGVGVQRDYVRPTMNAGQIFTDIPQRPFESLTAQDVETWRNRFSAMKGNIFEQGSTTTDDDIMGALAGAIEKRKADGTPTFYAGLNKNDVLDVVGGNLLEFGDTVETLSDKIYKSDLFRAPGENALRVGDRPVKVQAVDASGAPVLKDPSMGMSDDDITSAAMEVSSRLGLDEGYIKHFSKIGEALKYLPNMDKEQAKDVMNRNYANMRRQQTEFGQMNVRNALIPGFNAATALAAGDKAGAIGALGSYGAQKGGEFLAGGIADKIGGEFAADMADRFADPAFGVASKLGGVLGRIGSGALRAAGGVKEKDRTQADKSGAGAGQAIGTAAGAALGTLIPIPVVGTLIGATIGGFVGDALGGKIGDAVGGGQERAEKEAEKRRIADLEKENKKQLKAQMEAFKESQKYQNAMVEFQKQAAENAKLNARYVQATGQSFKSAGELLQQDMSFISASNLISGRFVDLPGQSVQAAAGEAYAKINTGSFDSGIKPPQRTTMVLSDGTPLSAEGGAIKVPAQLVNTGEVQGIEPVTVPVNPVLSGLIEHPDIKVNVSPIAKGGGIAPGAGPFPQPGFTQEELLKDIHLKKGIIS